VLKRRECSGFARVNKVTSASLGYPLSVFKKNSTLNCIETPGCVEHIKCTGSIRELLCENHNEAKQDDGHRLNSWPSDSSAIWRIIPY